MRSSAFSTGNPFWQFNMERTHFVKPRIWTINIMHRFIFISNMSCRQTDTSFNFITFCSGQMGPRICLFQEHGRSILLKTARWELTSYIEFKPGGHSQHDAQRWSHPVLGTQLMYHREACCLTFPPIDWCVFEAHDMRPPLAFPTMDGTNTMPTQCWSTKVPART